MLGRGPDLKVLHPENVFPSFEALSGPVAGSLGSRRECEGVRVVAVSKARKDGGC